MRNGDHRPHLVYVGLLKTVSYFCLEGYYLKGAHTLTCHPTGWDYEAPICEPEVPINKCKAQLSELKNGFIDGEIKEYYYPGEKIWYFCYAPWVMDGAPDVACKPDGTWNFPAPKCELKDKKCFRRDPPAYGSQNPDQPLYEPKQPVYYSCDPHFELQGSPVAFCTPTGEWTHPVPTCEAPTCRDPIAPEDGYFAPNQKKYRPGDMVIFNCVKHTTLVGYKKLTCQRNGEWDFEEPICKPITCQPLTPPLYGSLSPVKPIYSVKDRIYFDCDEHFDLIGAKHVICLDTGDWSDDVPECRPQQCDVPVIDYGKFSPVQVAYDVGDYVKFVCDNGFLLQGVKEIHCLENGKWSDEFPICHPIQCERPIFDDGTLEEDKVLYDIDDMVFFTCNMGFVIEGPKKLTCLDTGLWSGDFPICNPVMCERPFLDNGFLVEDQISYSVGQMVNFFCNDGFSRVGVKKVTCLKTGKWSDEFPTCERDMCEEPFIANGSFEENDGSYPIGDMVVFSCDAGHILKGAKKITCESDSEWSAPFPICVPVLCERPNVDNGILTPDVEYYAVTQMVIIDCEKGFELKGYSKLTCQADGNFDRPAPTCEPIKCDRPTFKNGFLDEDKPSYDVHESVVFICKPGFRLQGLRKLKCGFDGEWSDEFPICIPLKCVVPIITNGSVKPPKDQYHVNDEVTFKCDDGYILKGSKKLQCEENGEWSDDFPICKRVTCSPRPRINNGRFEDIQDVYVPGDMVKFFCDRNFFLVGEKKITCQNNGRWSDPFPACQEYICPVPQIDNGSFQPEQNEYLVDDFVNFVCDAGFTRVGPKKVTCLELGQWSDDFPICEPNQCVQPVIDNGSFDPIKNGYDIGDMVVFDCEDGFDLVGRKKLRCQPSGEWSDEFPTCEPVTCPRPVVSDGVTFLPSQNDYDVGQYITFKCRRGTTLVGEETVRCLNNGDWSDEFPICEPNKCVQPDIAYGKFNPYKAIYHVGDKVTFTCDDGFVLDGDKILRCLVDGVWSDEFPVCERPRCPTPEIVYGSFSPLQNIYYYLDVVYFECNDHFTLVGSEEIKCLRTGEWNYPFPTCERDQCEPPVQNPNIISVEPSQTAYDVGDEVTFECQRGFKLVGSETSSCKPDLTWFPEEPTCMKIIVCRQPSRPRYSTVDPDQRVYKVGETITYKCRRGFELKGDSVLTCQDDGNFDLRPPTCKRPPAKCRRPYTPRKLTISPDQKYYQPGDVITFECKKPYGLDGNAEATCKTNGRWSSYVPSCVDAPSHSCQYRCDEDWGFGQPCQCNEYCKYFSKETRPTFACCEDREEYCKA